MAHNTQIYVIRRCVRKNIVVVNELYNVILFILLLGQSIFIKIRYGFL
jgi:hypothetical protein